jgi:hypothetical protein
VAVAAPVDARKATAAMHAALAAKGLLPRGTIADAGDVAAVRLADRQRQPTPALKTEQA